MKNCPLSSEGNFFEDYGCLFANLAAYHLEGYFSKVQKRALLAAYLLERNFSDTIQFANFCPIKRGQKIFFRFCGGV